MKKGIHPKTNFEAKVTDLSAGKTFNIASTKDDIQAEVTYLSHPFYTGKQKIVDTENLVKKFQGKRASADISKINNKKQKAISRRAKSNSIKTTNSTTLKDLLKQYQ